MFEEYKKLLNWSELKKLNSWEQLKGLSYTQQVSFTVISTLKALIHWQVWVALGFLAVCVCLGKKFGVSFGIEIWSINLGVLFGAAIGGAVYSTVHIFEAKKALRQVMQKMDKRKNV